MRRSAPVFFVISLVAHVGSDINASMWVFFALRVPSFVMLCLGNGWLPLFCLNFAFFAFGSLDFVGFPTNV